MKILSLFLLTALSLNLFSQEHEKECTYTSERNLSTITWTAYKTPKKVGVDGSFNKINIAGMPNDVFTSFLESLHFTIDTSTVNTKNPARDQKIFKFFFEQMVAGKFIKGFVTKVTAKNTTSGEMDVNFWINGVNHIEKLQYEFSPIHRKLTAKGSIDVLKYSMNNQLSALNKACFALHEGKTWSDVAVAVEMQLSPCFQF